MHTRLIFCLLYFISFPTFGQVFLIDNTDKTPISFAHVISEDGRLIGTSNLNGYIELDPGYNRKDQHFTLQHLSYENKEITSEELFARDTISMLNKTYLLPDILISTGKKEVVVLKGYYRSYELDDDVPKFYSDGIVEYYIPLANEKKIKMKLIDYCSYGNNTLIEKEKKRTNTIVMRLAGIPRIGDHSILESLGKKYTTRKISTTYTGIIKDTSIVGTIKQDLVDNTICLNLDFVAPEQNETKTLFNYTSQIVNNELMEIYPNNELSELSLKEILRRKKHRKIFFKHQDDKGFVKLEGIDELYIFDKNYISTNEFKKIKSDSYAFPESSSYSNEYWKDLNRYNIPATSKNVENLIGETLTKYQ